MSGRDKLLEVFSSYAEGGSSAERQVACVKFQSKNRYGFYLRDGSSVKSFSAPVGVFDHPTMQGVLERIKAKGLYFEHPAQLGLSSVPRITKSNATLLKNFQVSVYPLVNTFVGYLTKRLRPEQLALISDYTIQSVIAEQGTGRFELKLNRNTAYFQNKAGELADLSGGGDWEFLALRYYPEGSKCTLGHDLKWEFVAREKNTGRQLTFGETCVQDFFHVDEQVSEQLSNFKTVYLNAMLEYALRDAVAQSYHYHVGVFQLSLYDFVREKGWVSETATSKTLVRWMEQFLDSKLLPPADLVVKFSRLFEPCLDTLLKWVNPLSSKARLALALGIFGTSLLDVDTTDYQNFSRNHEPDSLDLFGVLSSDDTFVRSRVIDVLGTFSRSFTASNELQELLIYLNSLTIRLSFYELWCRLDYVSAQIQERELDFLTNPAKNFKGSSYWKGVFASGSLKGLASPQELSDYVGDEVILDLVHSMYSTTGTVAEVQSKYETIYEKVVQYVESKQVREEVKAEQVSSTETKTERVSHVEEQMELVSGVVGSVADGTYKYVVGLDVQPVDVRLREEFKDAESYQFYLDSIAKRSDSTYFVFPGENYEAINEYSVTNKSLTVLWKVLNAYTDKGFDFTGAMVLVKGLQARRCASKSERSCLMDIIQALANLYRDGHRLTSKGYLAFVQAEGGFADYL